MSFDSLALLVAAPFIGSFLSVLAVRLPANEDIVVARSRCASCSRVLGPLELIPLLSWIAQRGRCRGCGSKIGALYPLMEIGALVVVVWAIFAVDGGVVLWATVALGWALLALAAMDLRAFILSDVLTLPLVAGGLALAWWIDGNNALYHVLAAALGFALMVAAAWAYRTLRGREGLGFGDAKLMAAAGAWTGVEGISTVLLYGAVSCLAAVAALRFTGRTFEGETPIPLGAGLALGLWLTWLYGPLLMGTA